MSKLVRDRIPDLIRAEGTEPVVTVDRSVGPLLAKLREEVAELEAAPDIEAQLDELADVHEVFLALVRRLRGRYGLPEIIRRMHAKREQRGGFDEGLILHTDRPTLPETLGSRVFHEGAMELYDKALEAEARGDDPAAGKAWFRAAVILEVEACDRQAARLGTSLSLTVLRRSAAVLALKGGELAEARRLANLGLADDPHPEIAAELREVLADVERRGG